MDYADAKKTARRDIEGEQGYVLGGYNRGNPSEDYKSTGSSNKSAGCSPGSVN